MPKFLSSQYLVALSVLLLGLSARAVVPWTLLVNSNNVIVVTNAAYGAVGDGVFTNTTAIQNAINQAAKGGTTNGLSGGTVKIPGPGIYVCGPLNMSNYVNLQVDAGAILRMLPYGSYPGAPYRTTDTVPDFISAANLHDLAVSGPGAIDGQGSAWWPGYATNNRPIMIYFSSCNRQLIQNITLSNSPMFHIAIGGGSSGNKTVQGVIIRAPSSSDPVNPSRNTDACDVGGTNILVQNCDISTGDDDFTCGGGTYDVLITNNVYGNGHGVSIGSYTSPGVSNITVINCTFNGTDNGIRLKSQRGRGGLIQNLNYLNLTMTNVDWPLLVYSYYEYGLGTLTYVDPVFAANVAATNSTPLTNTTPIWQNITFSNIVATMPAGRPPLMVWGLPEAPASNIVFRSVNITSSSTLDPGVYNATNIQFIDCNFNLPAGVNDMQCWNAGLIFTNSTGTPTTTNKWVLDGLTTNGIGNTLAFYNTLSSLKNTNALDDGPLTLSASTFTVSNNLSLAPDTVLNFVLGTNTTRLAVTGNLALGGTNNIYAGAGFTNGTYTLITYSGALSGAVPVLGAIPFGYSCAYDTNTAGNVKLVVTTAISAPAAPAGLSATAGNTQVALSWSASSGATSYNVKRATASGGPYTTITNVTATSCTDTGLVNGTTYYYVVSAVNAGGESANSAEVNATPLAIIFSDNFSASTLNSSTPSAPTASGTSYQLISSKTWNPAPGIAAGDFKFGIAATSSGVIEAQALFTTSPVTLATVGDRLSLTVTFTNTTGLFAQAGAMGFGLYNSGQNGPVPGGLNGTAISSNTNNATGNAQNWVGYVGQLAFTNASSQILTRAAQSGAGNNNQDLVTSGSSSSSYSNPVGTTVGTASSAASVVLPANSLCTEVFTITLTASNTLAITNSLYAGADTSGALLSQFGAIASGSTYLTNHFDALAIGWRATSATAPTMIDINNISVIAGGNADLVSPPAAPTGLNATAGNAQVALSWTASSGAASYNVKRAIVNGGPYTTITNLTATSYTDTGLVNGMTYYYVVSALNSGGESANSTQASATPIASVAPTITGLTNQIVNACFTATLAPAIGGTPAPALQWSVNGTPISGATNASLTLTNVQLSQDGYIYSLTATNTAGGTASSMTLSVVQSLFNVQLNGFGTTYSGAGQIGSAGDVWNNPPLSNVENNGTIHSNTTSLANNVSLVDSRGVSSTVTFSLSATHYKGYLATSSGAGEIAGLNDHSVKFDYDGVTPPSGTISLAGLPPNTSLFLYGYGTTTYASPIGSVWNFAAANGGAGANQGGPLSDPNGMNLTVSTNQGKSWVKVFGTTDGSGNLTVNLAPTTSSGGVWWQLYLNGFQLRLVSPLLVSGMTNLMPVNGATGVCYDTPLYLNFPTTPTLRAAGSIKIYNASNPATPVDTIDLSQCVVNDATYAANVQPYTIGGQTFTNFPVIITGTTAAIYPHHGVLTSNQTYYVTVDNGAFTDSDGNYYVGITNTNAWRFTTKAGGPLNPTNLVVAQDYSGDFATAQGAVDSIASGNTTRTIINIRDGTYTEIVNINSRHNLDLRGQSRSGTIIGYPNNNNVYAAAPYRSSFVLNGNDCTLETLTLTNMTPRGGAQAEAIDVEGTRAILYNMNLASYQDTFLVHSAGKLVYFQDSLVQGDADFNWGYGTVYYTNCEIRCLTAGGLVTQPRSPYTTNGFGFINCRITKGYSGTNAFYLGRTISTPSTPSEVLFAKCLMDDVVTGYASDAGTNMADYACSNLTATAAKTLAYSTHLNSGDPYVIAVQSADTWLYGWQPALAPNILTNPVNQTVAAGGTISLSVAATGIPQPAYQWLENGTNIPGANSSTLTIPGATAADSGNYSVLVSNAAGSVTSSMAVVFVPLSAPAGLSATAGDGQVGLNWNPSSGATSYNVKRATVNGGPYTTITNIAATSFTNSGLVNGTTYYYVVSALNAGGESANSAQASATPQVQAPAAPTSLGATAGNAQVTLTWSASGGATSYNVKRATVNGGPYTTITNVAATGCTDAGLVNGTTYYYVVSALNANGESANSAQASATPQAPAPAAPTGLTATAGNAQATLSWTASGSAASYNVKRSLTSGSGYATVTNVNATTVVDSGLSNGTTYYYVVSALNDGGESPNSAEVTVTPTDLTGWWKFDEASGATAADSSGGNAGTLQSGATWTTGIISNAVHLDGSANGCVTFPAGLVSTLNDFSVSAWVNVDTNATWARVFDFGSGTGSYMFLTPSSGGSTVRYAITTSGGSGEQQINGSTVLSTGIWHHVAMTLSGTVGILYVDGTAVGTNNSMTLNPSSLGSTTQNYLGKSQYAADPTLSGGVDDFRIYNRALSAAEVSTLADAGLPSPWNTSDIGAVGLIGAADYVNGTYTIQGSGTNVAGGADALRFVYQLSSGDCSNTIRVVSIQNTGANAKAGVMIRESLAANAREAGIWVTPGSGIIFTYRSSTGGSTTVSISTGKTAPYWVRIARVGNSFRAYYSANGATWTQLGSKTFSMSTSAYIGMGAESGVTNVLNTTTMDGATTVP